jgi:putative transcriptional regulator
LRLGAANRGAGLPHPRAARAPEQEPHRGGDATRCAMSRRFAVLIPISLILLATCGAGRLGAALIAPAPSRADKTQEPAPGMFLVAARSFLDPQFSRTVVYLLQHDRHASFGVIVNHPLRTNLSQRVTGLEGTPLASQPVNNGGPVNPEMLVTLVENRSWENNYDIGLLRRVTDGVFASVNPLILDKLLQDTSGPLGRVRFFYGHVGWVPGQLEQELDLHDWHLVDGNVEEVFGRNAAGLWKRLIDRLEPAALLPAPERSPRP